MKLAVCAVTIGLFTLVHSSIAATRTVEGHVVGGGAPVARSTVVLWAAGQDSPRKLAETRTSDDGAFTLRTDAETAGTGVLYLVARGGEPARGSDRQANSAIALLAVVGTTLPARVTINELTTVASVWTAAQFLKGDALSGNPLRLRIAAGNVPNLVDLGTGGFGPVIQDPLNSNLTPSLAIFATLGNLLAGCTTRVRQDACSQLFAAATAPGVAAPGDTLAAAQVIARRPWYQPGKLFALQDQFYPRAKADNPGSRAAPFRPYLTWAPTSWTLALTYAGGGLNSLGGIAIDGDGNAWAANNFLVGSQSTLYSSVGGGLSQLAPNGRPISPMTFGYSGGGVDLPGFGLAIAANDKVWITSLQGKTISVFDRKTGKPLSPPTGYNFDGRLGAMQGIISTPSGDIWAVDNDNSQIAYLPKGDPAQGRLLCRTVDKKPTDGTCRVIGPFHLAIDQRNRIWITNGNADTVTRFPADNPSQAEILKVHYSPKAIAIDSRGNAWVNNALGSPGIMEKLRLLWAELRAKLRPAGGNNQVETFHSLFNTLKAYPGGNVSLLQPDGSEAPGSPFDGAGSINGPWGIAIDGDDHIWVANAIGNSITQLCGVRTETCPPGYKTGDAISPPRTGYNGQGMQILTDIAIDPAGNVWVANNWDRVDEGFKRTPDPALATRFGGNGFVVFFGLAKPVTTPALGPVQAF